MITTKKAEITNVPEVVKGPRSISFGTFDWRLCEAAVQGNLADSEMRYSEVTDAEDHSGNKIDFVVKVADVDGNSYSAKSENNGKQGCFGMINMLTGTTTAFDFAFYISGTSTPYTMKNFFFTVYDIDAKNAEKEKGHESVTFDTPVASFSTTDTTELAQSGSNDDGTLTFSAEQNGNAKDNPSDPEGMTQQQLDRAVKVEYADVADFRITFGITKGSQARNIFFAGQSNLLPPAVPPRCDESANKMSFSQDKVTVNDLGNTNITFNDVTDGVKLVVESQDTYQAHNIALNGVDEHGFGIINMKTGTQSNMHFRFVDAANAPKTQEYLYLSFYDIDQYKNKAFEIIKICTGSESFVKLYLPENPELEVSSDGPCHTIKAKAEGVENPLSPSAMTDRQKSNAFTLAFSQVEAFDVSFEIDHVKGPANGRNFIFSGNSAFC